MIVTVALLPTRASAADLKVDILGLRNTEGVLRLSLYNDDSTFLTSQGRLASLKLMQLRAHHVQACFADLPPGMYAVTVHHDENDDGELNRNAVGLPREGYGFSNDARRPFAPPSFTQAAVTIAHEDTTIKITVHY
jgi:uncharacterized protein (DUF2141 family)